MRRTTGAISRTSIVEGHGRHQRSPRRPPGPRASSYLLTKAAGSKKALADIRQLLSLFEIAPVNRPVLEAALTLGFDDFEDGVLHEAARQIDAHAIVTRNAGDFEQADLPVYTPEELVEILDLQAG
jgi:hypothetical protein